MTVGSAAAWYSDPSKAGKPAVRAVSQRPRALEARGLATMHHLLVQLRQVELRPRFAEACKAFGDIVWCDDLDDLVARAPARASDVAFQQLTDQALHRRVPTPFIPVVRFCLDHAASAPRVEVIARSVGQNSKALATQLKRAGVPPVSTLVMWSKALVAAYRLEKTTESVAVIARSLGFSSGSALRRLLKRCANEPPKRSGRMGDSDGCFAASSVS